jgi:hypothetical protein
MFASLFLLMVLAHPAPQASSPCSGCTLVEQAMQTAAAIHAGMTRAEVEKTYRQDGGLSALDVVRYLDRHCEDIKVDVRYRLLRHGSTLPGDVVVSVSKPYLETPYYD